MTVKEWLKLCLKIALTVSALGYLFRHLPFQSLWNLIQNADMLYLALAFFLFVSSKVVSAFRLYRLFSLSSCKVGFGENFKLYWLGMFYNQFLPSGVGGDAYKAIWLKKHLGLSRSVSSRIILMDRISGLLALVGLLMLSAAIKEPKYSVYLLFMLVVGYIVYSKLYNWLLSFQWEVGCEALSWMVQLCQYMSAYFILLSLHVSSGHLAYLIAFLVSSVASVLPITLGGIGMRELAFVWASDFLFLQKEMAISIGFLFYMISLVAALGGAIYVFRPIHIKPVSMDFTGNI